MKQRVKYFLAALPQSVMGRSSEPGPSGSSPALEGETLSAKLVLDSANYFLGKIVPGLMGFLSVLIFVRLIGVEQYGRYAVAFAVVMAFASGMAGWLGQGILRFQSQAVDTLEVATFSRATRWGTLLSVAIGACVLAIVLPLSGIDKGWQVLVPVLLLAGIVAYTVTIARFQAALRSAKVLHFEIVRSVACLIIPAGLVLVTGKKAYWLLILGIGLGYLLPLLSEGVIGRARRQSTPTIAIAPRPYQERAVLGTLWGFGWPVALWMLAQQGLQVSDPSCCSTLSDIRPPASMLRCMTW